MPAGSLKNDNRVTDDMLGEDGVLAEQPQPKTAVSAAHTNSRRAREVMSYIGIKSAAREEESRRVCIGVKIRKV